MSKAIEKQERQVDPWTDFDRAFEAMHQRLLGAWGITPFGSPFGPIEPGSGGRLRAARTDVSDTGSAYKVVAEVPGIPKEKLDIRIRGSSVEIRGENTEEKVEKDHSFLHRERSYAGYYRSFELPEPVVAGEAKAKVENGLLELELPKQRPTLSPAEVKVAVE